MYKSNSTKMDQMIITSLSLSNVLPKVKPIVKFPCSHPPYSINRNSTLIKCNSKWHCLENSSVNRVRCLHTSSSMNTITKEELAMLAKVKQIRQKKYIKNSNIPNVQKMQENLTNKARERKVPSSRLGRVISFGGNSKLLVIKFKFINVYLLQV